MSMLGSDIFKLSYEKSLMLKDDLAKNWFYQIVGTSIGVAIIFDYGGSSKIVSQYILKNAESEFILYIILPVVLIYLNMRFGILLALYWESRKLTEKLIEENIEDATLIERAKKTCETSSYFEAYFSQDAKPSMMIFSLILPILFSASHSTSIYLLMQITPCEIVKYLMGLIYIAFILILYYGFYSNNKEYRFTKASVLATLTLIPFWMLVIFLQESQLNLQSWKIIAN